ncbi:MAG: efflux RND transporter periplasmic adaptor subunit [Pseudomonadota bacterium]
MFFRSLFSLAVLTAFAFPALAQDAPTKIAKLTTVETPDADLTRRFFGRVVAKETVDLAFQVGGQILEFPAIEGEFIEAGGLVAQLDLEPFELAVSQAQANKEQADRTLARFERLRDSAVSDVQIEDAGTQAELAAIALRSAQRDLEQATLKAPFQALVAERQVSNFETIGGGTSVVRIHDMSEVRIEIDVPEILFQTAGSDPDVDLVAQFPASDQQFELEVREFNAETSEIGQTFSLTLGMDTPEDIVIFPGSSAEVYATLNAVNSQPEIPASAIVSSNDGMPNVYVFSPSGADEGTIELVQIEIEPTTNGAVRVVSGVEIGQEIVATGGGTLTDGQTVRRFTGFNN